MTARDLTDVEAEGLVRAAMRLADWVNGGGLDRLSAAVESLDAKINTNGRSSVLVEERSA